MISLLFVAMLAITGSSLADRNCSVPIYRACETPYPIRFFPKNETQMRDICEFILNFSECAKDMAETCEEHSSEYPRFNALLSAAKDLCNENNSMHIAIADNLPCISELASQPDLCPPPITRKKIVNYAESLKEQGIPYVGITENDTHLCMFHLNAVGCPVATIGKECSTDAKDAFIELSQRLVVPVAHCREEIIERLPAIVELYEVEDEERQEEEHAEAEAER